MQHLSTNKPENLTETKLKYKIKSILNNNTPAFQHKVGKTIRQRLGISWKTFNDWLNIPKDGKREIPSGQLRIISEILYTPMEDLFN